MASEFQPEKPHPPDKKSTSWGSLVITALVCGLGMVMLLAIGAPRWFENTTANWVVTAGAGLATAIAVVVIGLLLRRRERTDISSPS